MIKITDKFFINATTNCYILEEKSTIQDKESKNFGKVVFKEIGYYTMSETGFCTKVCAIEGYYISNNFAKNAMIHVNLV